ncbi:hypothetical protein KCMC57_up22500 [Kitasatospora sp. CMC57]|uniref:TPM domain-containing protein n=1 Tax=Kitasatospora sp. CMC57 TaxID=3231513 RepID=A0AB33JV41_9ACTN
MRSTQLRRPKATALLGLLLAALLLLPATAASAATGGVEEAAGVLKQGQVYVDPSMTGRFSTADAAALTERIRKADKPVFVAVLPASEQYPAQTVARDLRTRVGVTGLYAIWRGEEFKAFSDPAAISGAAANNLAGAALRAHPGDINGTLNDFVGQALGQVRGKGVAGSSDGGGIGVAAIVVPVVLLALAGGGVFLLFRRSKRRKEEQVRAELAQLRVVVDEDITAFGEELDRLDFAPGDPSADDAQRADYAHALDCYESAKRAMDAATEPEQVRPVTEALADGRFALATLTARREQRPLPDRRPPCFFDPRHGPSSKDADWAPAGGVRRTVPVCAADAAKLAAGEEPEARTVQTEHGREPYWNAGPAYSPWAGGYFGGGMLPGLLVGTMLGSMMASPGTAWAAGGEGYQDGYQGGDDSGADFNPSDFGGFDGGGGGDFGGGGGGDFGGF